MAQDGRHYEYVGFNCNKVGFLGNRGAFRISSKSKKVTMSVIVPRESIEREKLKVRKGEKDTERDRETD